MRHTRKLIHGIRVSSDVTQAELKQAAADRMEKQARHPWRKPLRFGKKGLK